MRLYKTILTSHTHVSYYGQHIKIQLLSFVKYIHGSVEYHIVSKTVTPVTVGVHFKGNKVTDNCGREQFFVCVILLFISA